jgi:hypothetical protein
MLAPAMGRRLLVTALSIAACALGSPVVGAASAQSPPDEVSAQIASLFGDYAQEYQELQSQMGAVQSTFANMLQGVGATPGQALGGICDASVSVFGGAHVAIGPLHSCGAVPAHPSPFLAATHALLSQLATTVLGQSTTMQGLLNAATATAQQFLSFDPSLVPAAMFASFLGQHSLFTATFANGLPLTTQMSHVIGSLDARFDVFSTWFGNASVRRLRGRPVARTAAFAPRTRADAWAGLVELNAELRAILHGPGRVPAHLELPARPHLPVTVVVCEAAHCAIDVQAVLTVGGEERPLAGQRLQLGSGEKAIVHVGLTRDELDALRRHGGGRLAVTLASGGHARTLHARLAV